MLKEHNSSKEPKCLFSNLLSVGLVGALYARSKRLHVRLQDFSHFYVNWGVPKFG